MASLRIIKRRIKSVKSTRQITKAMQMVAAAKLKKAEFRLISSRPYAQRMESLLNRLLQANTGEISNPLLTQRDIKTELVVIVSSDKGLCGSYNMNLLRKADEYLKTCDPQKIQLGLIGRRAVDYFSRRGYKIRFQVTDLSGNVDYPRIRQIAQDIARDFVTGQVDHVKLVYTRFLSSVRYNPLIVTYLPFTLEPVASTESVTPKKEINYIFEPGVLSIFNEFMPRFLVTKLYISIVESFTSEHSARMIAMKNATEAAEDMISSLTLLSNKLRQAQITKEISEIVGGAEAQKG